MFTHFCFQILILFFILLDKENVHLYYAGHSLRYKWILTIHVFMVDHRSTSLPECRPTEKPWFLMRFPDEEAEYKFRKFQKFPISLTSLH